MIDNAKPVDCLQVSDLEAHPVWQFSVARGGDETLVNPIKRRPITKFGGKIIATQVTLRNGQKMWATLGNIKPHSADLTEQFLSLSAPLNNEWFTLARYFDFDYKDRGPSALARRLGLPLDQVFPILYDVRKETGNDSEALRGQIFLEPRVRLSREELMTLTISELEI